MEFLKSHWFLIMMLAIATVLVFVWLFVFNRKRLNAKWWEILIVALIHVLYGVGTVVFWALLEAGFDTTKAGNMSMFGGVFLMPVMYIVYAKIKKLPAGLVFDVFAIALIATLFCARCNCLYAGCCKGIEIGSTGYLYPTREAELLFYAIFMIVIIPWILRDRSKGRVYPIYLLSYGLARFLIESFRESSAAGFLHMGHIWAMVSVVVGVGFIVARVIINKRKEAKNA